MPDTQHVPFNGRYLPPFSHVRQTLQVTTTRGELRVSLPYDDLLVILRRVLGGVIVDEDWYLAMYPDVAAAIEEGTAQSARQHFIDDGYFEGRLPFPPELDEAWYLGRYPDVAAGVRDGAITSAREHFTRDGYREGRLPFAQVESVARD